MLQTANGVRIEEALVKRAEERKNAEAKRPRLLEQIRQGELSEFNFLIWLHQTGKNPEFKGFRRQHGVENKHRK